MKQIDGCWVLSGFCVGPQLYSMQMLWITKKTNFNGHSLLARLWMEGSFEFALARNRITATTQQRIRKTSTPHNQQSWQNQFSNRKALSGCRHSLWVNITPRCARPSAKILSSVSIHWYIIIFHFNILIYHFLPFQYIDISLSSLSIHRYIIIKCMYLYVIVITCTFVLDVVYHSVVNWIGLVWITFFLFNHAWRDSVHIWDISRFLAKTFCKFINPDEVRTTVGK